MLANSSHYHHNMSKLPFPQRALNNIKSFEDQAWPHFSPILTQNSLKTKTPKKFQYKDDNLLSDKLSLASTSPSLTSLSPSPSSESFSLTSSQDQLSLSPNEEEGSTTKKKRKRKCVLKVGYKKKLKTEVCKFWAESGSCPYGDQCAFAHGKDEIRDKIHTASNYKSRRCAGYHDNGVCMYGTRCHFVHSLREDVKKNEKLGEDSSENDMENVEIWCNGDDDCVCKRRRNRIQRLPCFSNFCEY